MGTTERGQDNPVCEMHSRGLPISAGKNVRSEWSGVIEHPSTPPDELPQCGWQGLGRGLASFSFTFVVVGLDPVRERGLSLRD